MVTQRRRRKRWVRWLMFLAGALVAYLVVLAGCIYISGHIDERAPADVIIVLGAAQYDGQPSPVYRARLEHALMLYREGYATRLLFTGGNRPGDRFTEAEAGRAFARTQGVPAQNILLESRGRTTWQSLQAAAAIMRRHHLQRALLVSDPFHAFRLRRMARDLQMQAGVSPVAHSRIRSGRLKAQYILREMVVYIAYRLAGV